MARQPRLPVSSRVRVRRLHERGRYDRASIYAILDAAFLCHIGYAIDGQPYVTPTSYWRDGDTLYWHGSAASRMLKAQAQGIPVCFTVTLVDALVLARSAFHHSVNYRSVMAFGRARPIAGRAEKLAAMEAFVERMFPGRWTELRPPLEQEVKATAVLAMPIEEASAKVRSGPPIDADPDYALPIWAGLLELETVVAGLSGDGRGVGAGPPPVHLANYGPGRTFAELLAAAARRGAAPAAD